MLILIIRIIVLTYNFIALFLKSLKTIKKSYNTRYSYN